MLTIEKKYIVDENNNRLAVEIDYKTFQNIEEILEDYALYQLIQETDDSESLDATEAKTYYQQLLGKNGDQV